MSEIPIFDKIRRLKVAHTFIREAEHDLHEQLSELFPLGAPVRWRRGGRDQSGVVYRLGYGDTLFALNSKTGSVVKISAFDIIQALQEEAAQ